MTSLDLSQASISNSTGRNEVLFRFNNNNFQYLNLQNNRNTAWMCLCSWTDCPFPVYSTVNTCKYIPFLEGNPNLTEVKINCGEKFYYENTYSNQYIFTENCAVSATQESDFSKKFKIYPNPANDFIAIDTKETINEISILDYSGKIISSKKEKLTNISLHHLPKGNYVIKIKTLEKTFSYKFIKN
ncbi:MAG: T9SS type A sorting domain-containing protein [Flavobacteriia bacterium]|nr:T9SS type A sorting domain-containing protein [Flavobacteriia bacterium]MBH2024557.1 T9SS type A sorting domain-containing protein [Flavobacteriales bacterium]